MIWNDRNQGIMGKNRMNESRIMRDAKIYVESFITNIEAKGYVHVLTINPRWSPPPVGLYKINVNGSWREYKCIGGLGCVLRDVNGCFMAGFLKGNTRAVEVVVCEVLAARDALVFTLDIGLSKVVLEMDCSVVINVIKYSDRELLELGRICADIKRLGQRLQHFEVQHVLRSCNKIDHVLAKKALDFSNIFVWMEEAHDDIVHLLLADCSSVVS
ncbi:uncharacterized protein A4U43_C08F10790 [Asparagus officinalis]|uniref:uncharacterized protein LOC109820994 n=1 Tax=Asparagus officinalis TaxID=4686 RepID=UPI00098DE1D3|nr:uncharacterized protein LOC109820994 [Asparagus officinalis]ONK59797.1 uncharacterized protein A4U43_C08F10790 [Asparagus officinalis]